MAERSQAGFTLIELVMFIIIVSVGLTGVLVAFNTVVAKSADPLVSKQVLRIAEATMQEVLQKSYQNDFGDADNSSATLGCTPSTTPSCRKNTPADRANYNDVDDYDGYAQTGITLLDGVTPIPALSAYTLSISIDASGATLGSLAAPNIKSVTVTVANGNQSLTLVGYRSNYGY